jgi:hypothetical protein
MNFLRWFFNDNRVWFWICLSLIGFAIFDKLTGQWAWNSWVSLACGVIGTPVYGRRVWRARRLQQQ